MFDIAQIENISFDRDFVEQIEQQTEIVSLKDDFEDATTIYFTKAGIRDDKMFLKGYFYMYSVEKYGVNEFEFFGLTFKTHNSYSYIEVICNSEQITLAKGDYLIILFSDKTKINLIFNNPQLGSKYIHRNTTELTGEDLFNFLNKDIDKVKVISARKSLYTIYGLNNSNSPSNHGYLQHHTALEAQFLLHYMTYKFIEFNLVNTI